MRRANSSCSMASFADLPDEILLEVWTYICPDDIENFALVDRKLHILGRKVMQKHQGLKKLYSLVSNQQRGSFISASRPTARSELLIHMVTDIANDARVASYVKELRMEDHSRTWGDGPSHDGDAERKEATEANLDLLLDLMEQCPYVLASEARTWWMEMGLGSEDAMLGILLYLLPNIRTIRFVPYMFDFLNCFKMLNRLSEDPYSTSLSQLTELIVDCPEPDGTADLTLLSTFAKLPSMAIISAENIAEDADIGGRPEERRQLFHPQISNVKELSLVEANIPPKVLRDFLSMFTCLRSFTYKPYASSYDRSYTIHEFDPLCIRNALADYTKDTLRHLEILSLKAESKYMGGVRNFKFLTTLVTNWSLLLREESCRDSRLVDALPASIQTVSLLVNKRFDAQHEKGTIEHLAKAKPFQVPRMRTLRLFQITEDAVKILSAGTLLQDAEAVRLALSFGTTTLPYPE